MDPETYNKSVIVIPDDNGTVLVPCGRIGPVTANGQIRIILRGVENTWELQKTPEGSFDVYAEANYRHLSNSNYICTVKTKVTTKEGNNHNFDGQSQISLESKHGR